MVIKIFHFRNSAFHLTAHELNGLKELCIFGAKFYIRNWFSSSFGISAPKNDFFLTRHLLVFGVRISLGVLKKLKQHLWYLIGIFSLITQSRLKKRDLTDLVVASFRER